MIPTSIDQMAVGREVVDYGDKSELLETLTQRIAFAVWQLQELEWAIAAFIVLMLKAHRGIGMEIGEQLLASAGKRTFGSLIKEAQGASLLEDKLANRFEKILNDRNWLIHRSRREHRGILSSRSRCNALASQIDAISTEALQLFKIIAELTEQYVKKSGIPQEIIEREAQRLLHEWGILQ
jgi:hypothetical protein